jgi:hypothetical protein
MLGILTLRVPFTQGLSVASVALGFAAMGEMHHRIGTLLRAGQSGGATSRVS